MYAQQPDRVLGTDLVGDPKPTPVRWCQCQRTRPGQRDKQRPVLASQFRAFDEDPYGPAAVRHRRIRRHPVNVAVHKNSVSLIAEDEANAWRGQAGRLDAGGEMVADR